MSTTNACCPVLGCRGPRTREHLRTHSGDDFVGTIDVLRAERDQLLAVVVPAGQRTG